MIYNEITQKFDTYSSNVLKKLRKENNMSMDDLAHKSGLSKSTISRYEKSGLSNVGMDKIKKIAAVFNVSVSYLCGWESRDLPYEYYQSLLPLIAEAGFSLEYECLTESFSLKSDSKYIPISTEDLKSLKDTTYSYFKFKLNEILDKAPAD